MLLTLLFDSKEVIIQGYNTEEVKILANTIIPISSFKKYICEKSLSINVPIDVKGMSGECERTEIFEEDSWRVTARFRFKDGTKYEVTSNTMSDRRDVERVKSSVSFKNYFSARKVLKMYRRRIDVLVKDGIASFRTGNKRFKYVCGEEDGELYCEFKKDNLTPLNKVLDSSLKDADLNFSNESKNYLFSIEAKGYRIDIEPKRFYDD